MVRAGRMDRSLTMLHRFYTGKERNDWTWVGEVAKQNRDAALCVVEKDEGELLQKVLWQ